MNYLKLVWKQTQKSGEIKNLFIIFGKFTCIVIENTRHVRSRKSICSVVH